MRTSAPLKILNLEDGFHLLVEVFVLGKTHFVVVDTGASRTVFDSTFLAGQLDTATADEISATTLFSTTATRQATVPLLKIGKLKITNCPVIALDLQSVIDTYVQFGFPAIVAVLGGDILTKYQAIINYPKLRLSLQLPGNAGGPGVNFGTETDTALHF
ncbi:aspartyl protease family protein [Pedobacter sp. SYP-B3415]|uniref:aspartyl protease family protein n=1 Tax=Pedobacter sp. SYP-B3415 TaxID=2496641 RepID=UPI00101C33DA|nr:aspartyl protease family protein [Pedobacter sp. SYP-B3415]